MGGRAGGGGVARERALVRVEGVAGAGAGSEHGRTGVVWVRAERAGGSGLYRLESCISPMWIRSTPASNTVVSPSDEHSRLHSPETEQLLLDHKATATSNSTACPSDEHPRVHSLEIEELLLEHKAAQTSNATASSSSDDSWVHSLDLNKLLVEHKAKVESTRRGDPSVSRVPSFIRNLKPHIYDPDFLPMGLYNRNFKGMSLSDHLKLEVLSCFLEPLKIDQDEWTTLCKELAAKPSTSDTPDLEYFYENDGTYSFLTPASVQSILVIDAFFIVAFFIWLIETETEAEGKWVSDERPPFIRHIFQIFYRGNVKNSDHIIARDIWWLWECQIPLFLVKNVWEKVASVAKIDSFDIDDIIKTSVKASMLYSGLLSEAFDPTVQDTKFDTCDHLLACLHTALSQICSDPISEKKPHNARRISLPSATRLAKSGIHFRGVAGAVFGEVRLVKSFFHLSITLYLPMIVVKDFTEKLLLNMCVYESVKRKRQGVHAWVLLMDELINTEEDVELLMEGKDPVIKRNALGDNKRVVDIFTNLLEGFTFEMGKESEHMYYVRDELIIWYSNWWRRAVVSLLRRFRLEPWLLLSLLAAIALLVLASLQTVYTILGLNKS
ncbi:hypothetical protein R1sor_002008 [Riccia sorocarpa]|uniref:Uncharacterized protein n=1 Tax=Riccia sorocarpa TaxID=122646 RepID=A0ABD3GZJ4_9MARC